MLFCAIWQQPWENVDRFNEKRKLWYETVKPATMKVVGAYSLQGPESKGIVLFETERAEDVNLFRNYFALAGATIDIRVATELGASIELVQSIQARW
ncbi:MAG: hypothetical protein AB1505_31645 [Candidatus Latescibacterota bacterium]